MNAITKTLIAIFIGSLVGFIGGFQGIAGGFYISMLLLATGMHDTQRMVAGTTLLALVFPISIGAVYEYWKSGDIDVPSALTITLFYMIFSWLGNTYVPYTMRISLGDVLRPTICFTIFIFLSYTLVTNFTRKD